MINHEDTNYQSTVKSNSIDINEKFGYDKTRLNIAFGLANSRGQSFDIANYVNWEAYILKMIRSEEDESITSEYTPVPIHQCTDSDRETYWKEITPLNAQYLDNMLCFDDPRSIQL